MISFSSFLLAAPGTRSGCGLCSVLEDIEFWGVEGEISLPADDNRSGEERPIRTLSLSAVCAGRCLGSRILLFIKEGGRKGVLRSRISWPCEAFLIWEAGVVGAAASEISGVGFYASIQLIGQTTKTGRARACLHGLSLGWRKRALRLGEAEYLNE